MIRALTSALILLALTGCLALPELPTVAQVCALPPAMWGPMLDAMHTDAASMALACALVK